ncbi:7a0664de-675f-4b44-b5ec-ebad90529cf8 [Sclerotinia trifoliorum]|uniref:U3 small nucleolar RNA-associated protein 11 n=1 Tax=Sclerotinia trifoliorum TaxID=28548 RepID=A0A8H2VNZ3_9HELO|nr:7a0664de-675f-4b44-b5ec-ebad90529cf8 [Sclerotinia trifoliorum]
MDKASKSVRDGRTYKERSQPEERKRWGLLEKHKDYSARARDFNKKKAKLKALKQKVLEKNPDEFYFGMVNKKGPVKTGKKYTGTVNGDRGNQVLNQDAVRLFKTQDLGYVRTMRNKALKEVEELEKRTVGIKGRGKKIVFVEDEEEQKEKVGEDVSDMDMDFDIDEDDEHDDTMKDENIEEDVSTKNLRKLQEKEAHKLEVKLLIARQRLRALTDAEEALDLQRAKMAKSSTMGGINKNGVKFKIRERKR